MTQNKITSISKKRYYNNIAVSMLDYKYEWENNVLKIYYTDSEPDIIGVDRQEFETYLKNKFNLK